LIATTTTTGGQGGQKSNAGKWSAHEKSQIKKIFRLSIMIFEMT
jgi:hypothetical protein